MDWFIWVIIGAIIFFFIVVALRLACKIRYRYWCRDDPHRQTPQQVLSTLYPPAPETQNYSDDPVRNNDNPPGYKDIKPAPESEKVPDSEDTPTIPPPSYDSVAPSGEV